MKIKLCGFKKLEDINFAFNAGVDYVGLNNISISKRYIHAEDILKLLSLVAEEKRSRLVVLLNYYDEDFVSELQNFGVGFVQTYLDDDANKVLLEKGFSLIKAFQVSSLDDIEDIKNQRLDDYVYVLLDTKTEALGGSGESFDWTLFQELKNSIDVNLILAGGLNPKNIREAIAKTNTDFIDLASGIEDEQGNKSFALIKELVETVNSIS